jgi:protein gp37
VSCADCASAATRAAIAARAVDSLQKLYDRCSEEGVKLTAEVERLRAEVEEHEAHCHRVVMAAAPRHTFQVLTKRAERMHTWFEWAGNEPRELFDELATDAVAGHLDACHLGGGKGPWPLPNVWLGASVEDQAAADERIPHLLATPSAVRFLSCEPLLGAVRLDNGDSGWLTCDGRPVADDTCCESHAVHGHHFHGIDWVIAGCESGPGARPAQVDWYRSLRDQCAAAGVAFFLKQAKEGYDDTLDDGIVDGMASQRKAGGVIGLPYLDGVQHAAFPEAR